MTWLSDMVQFMVFLAIPSDVQIGKLLEQAGVMIRGVLDAWQILRKSTIQLSTPT
jgi:hypothetical protein